MDFLFGSEGHMTLAQECARATLVFFYGLLLLRLSGRRTFAQRSAIDLIVCFIVGSGLGRVITGSAPLLGTLAAMGLLVVLHVGLAHAAARSRKFSEWVEGRAVILALDGKLDDARRCRHMISQADLEESLRRHNVSGLEETSRVTLEPSGAITVMKAGEKA